MPRELIQGIPIHYEQVGKGPDLILVHGLAANLAFWYFKVVPRLARDFRVTVFDLRGHGQSGMPKSGYTTADMASDLIGLAEHLKIERAHLAGHSFGGAVALHAAVLGPERWESLTLADCRVHAVQALPSTREGPAWRARRERMRERGIAVSEDTPKVVYTMLEELGGAVGSGDEEEMGLVIPFGTWNPKSRAGRRWLALRSDTTFRRDIRAPAGLERRAIRSVRTRTLLMYGEQSRCLPTFAGLKRLLPRHEGVILPNTGHFFPIQVPELFARRMTAFIREEGAAGSVGLRSIQREGTPWP